MRRLLLLVAFVLMLEPTAAMAAKQGKYLQSCGFANSGQVDPMVSPGQVADHPHDEFGAKGWSSTSTTADLMNSPTTCHIPGNHSAYWVPSMVAPDGTLIHATSASGYYGAFGAAVDEEVQQVPFGLRMIIGNSKSTVLQSTSIVQWRCDAAGQPTRSSPPTSCPAGVGVELSFMSPRYWNGVDLDSADHKSHVSYTKDAAHQVRISQLEWSFHFPAAAAQPGVMLSSDHGVGPAGRSAHFDDWEAFDPAQQGELQKCVNDTRFDETTLGKVTCGTYTYEGGVNGVAPNPWLSRLLPWTAHNDITLADGSPASLP